MNTLDVKMNAGKRQEMIDFVVYRMGVLANMNSDEHREMREIVKEYFTHHCETIRDGLNAMHEIREIVHGQL